MQDLKMESPVKDKGGLWKPDKEGNILLLSLQQRNLTWLPWFEPSEAHVKVLTCKSEM